MTTTHDNEEMDPSEEAMWRHRAANCEIPNSTEIYIAERELSRLAQSRAVSSTMPLGAAGAAADIPRLKHPTKIRRAQRSACVGGYPGTAAAMLDAVPPEIVKALTGKQVGILLDAMSVLSNKSKAIAEAEACGNGFIWDEVNQQLRDISPVLSRSTTSNEGDA